MGGLLHNVGNVLNSVVVASETLQGGLRALPITGLEKAATLLVEKEDDLPGYFATEPSARRLPRYLEAASATLGRERQVLDALSGRLVEDVEHIRKIVAAQLEVGRSGGHVEPTDLDDLLDVALACVGPTIARARVEVSRGRSDLNGPIPLDRHKVLQVLLNLLGNAADALRDVEGRRRIEVDLRSETGIVEVCVRDSGSGIAPEHLEQVFDFGFSTKAGGHGYGLHISAIAAAEMGGSLRASSAGLGKGAAFVLALPLEPRSRARTGTSLPPWKVERKAAEEPSVRTASAAPDQSRVLSVEAS